LKNNRTNFVNRESNIGKAGAWIYLIGDRRRYGRFRITSAGNDEYQEESIVPVQRNLTFLFDQNQYFKNL